MSGNWLLKYTNVVFIRAKINPKLSSYACINLCQQRCRQDHKVYPTFESRSAEPPHVPKHPTPAYDDQSMTVGA